MTTVNDDRIRAFLADEARRATAAAPSLNQAVGRLAARLEGRPSGASQRLIVLLAATLLLVAALGTALAVGSGILRLPLVIDSEEPSVDLGIFAPVAARIVYCTNSGLWAVDPSAQSAASTLVRLEGRADADAQCASDTVPLGWSRDGTELLFSRNDQTDESFSFERYLYILHADGTETQVTPEPVGGAAISPDGSRVVFAAERDDGLYVVDAEGGQPVRIAEGEEPTFSPDGTQIAYLALPRSVRGVPLRREHVWVANVDGTDAHEILADEPALAEGVFGLAWSPAGGRIAMENSLEGHVAIYTFAPDGSDFTEVITGGFNPHWSPDGSQIAYGALPGTPGLSIADADGSNVRTLDFGASGPWHPGTLESAPEPTSSSSAPSPPPLTERFDSTIHGISIDYPAGWQTRPATEPWTGGELSFDSPAADVIFDPTLGDRLYLVVASQPYALLSQDAWRDGVIGWLCTGEGMAFGSWTVDGADAFVVTCPSTASAALIFTDTRGYLIRSVASTDEPGLAEAYGWDWHRVVLETVDLRPEEAVDVTSPSPSP